MTGGSRGIGYAVAAVLVAEGADVAIVARDAGVLDDAVTRLRDGAAGRVEAVPADTSDDASVREMAATVADRLGGVDVLVNAAARPAVSDPLPELSGITDDAIRVEMETKLLGYLRCARALSPLMTAQGWGRIVNISGLNARRSTSLVGSVRNVSVAAMTAAMAQELGPKGVNVTVVHPGLTWTERMPGVIAERAQAQGVSERQVRAALDATTTIGRMTTAEEVADVVAFLCSPRSVAVNGDPIAAGGGTPGVTYY